MQVTRLAETSAVTMPFADEAWAALDALGQKVDDDCRTHDVRLTMGGEPTFVSIDDFKSAEWNTDALGPTKRIRADELIRRLRRRFAPGGFRITAKANGIRASRCRAGRFALYWRSDGEPVWRDDSLIAREAPGPRAGRRRREALREGIAARLGIDARSCHARVRGPGPRMIDEGAWPANLDPGDPRIDDPAERARLMREFEPAGPAPTGYVLPIQPATAPAHRAG